MRFFLWASVFLYAVKVFSFDVFFLMDAKTRGEDIISMYTTLTSPPFKGTGSQVAINTTKSGLIPSVQGIVPATNKTILIISYFTVQSAQVKYVVVPVEQITEVIYSPTTIPSSGFNAGITELDIIIDSHNRATDIQNIVGLLTSPTQIYKTNSSRVNIQTTLSGPFYYPLTGSQILNVAGVQVVGNGTQMIISYFVSGSTTAFIVVTPDQVTAINYVP